MAKRKTKKSKKRMTRHQSPADLPHVHFVLLAKLKQHYREYFKDYTPKDEYYSQMKKEAARLGIHPEK